MKRALALALIAFILVSCSSGRRGAQFTLDGVTAPPRVCALNPDNFAQAERIPDCVEREPHSGWQIRRLAVDCHLRQGHYVLA